MKRYILFLLFCMASAWMQAQVSTQNYVKSSTMLDENGNRRIDRIHYHDGLGRPFEEVQKCYPFTAADSSLITCRQYDEAGRVHGEFLPFPDRADFQHSGNIITKTFQYYKDLNPVTTTKYEASAMNRVVSVTSPGKAWQGHPRTFAYRSNTASGDLSCARYAVDASGNPVRKGNYSAGSLFVEETSDEDGRVSCRFTDLQGRLVLSRRMNGGMAHDTYYVYDDYGNLCHVLPPMVNHDISAENLARYAYSYKYDYRNRCIEKKLPGAGPVSYTYDCGNRLIFSQDGNQRNKELYTFHLYDNHGREIMQGETGKNGYWDTGRDLIRCIPDFLVPENLFAFKIPGTGYTSVTHEIAAATSALASLHFINYYDNYRFDKLTGFKDIHASGLELIPVPDAMASGSRIDLSGIYADVTIPLIEPFQPGALTGRMVANLADAAQRSYEVNLYNDKGELGETRRKNFLGKYEKTLYGYSFTGNVTRKEHIHAEETKFWTPVLSETYSYGYDKYDRLASVHHRLNDADSVRLAAYGYNTLGQTLSKQLHGDGIPGLGQEYAYNIRGWLTGIDGEKFSQNLDYDKGAGTPCYNGNISRMTWKAGDELIRREYKFTYDGLNRLNTAAYGEDLMLETTPDRFTEQVTAYDKNGNIKGLKRYGQTSAAAYGLIDNLTFTLEGNRLDRVDDAVTASAYNNGFEFRDGVKQANEYTYDANGNLIKDLNKNIADIQYNFLNLPGKVTFSDGSTISYVYAADGTKLRTVHKIGSTTTTTDYCGNVVYENGVRKLLLTEEGYVTLNDSKYHYYLKDHQGNNRVVINQSGAVEETNHYYPFGGVFAGTTDVQPYKYNGKELDAKKGLNWYDYGARHYDAMLGRFTTMDPLAEKYYEVSPYAYCLNDPVNLIDKYGMYPGPGDLFKTTREAAKDWGMYYNGASILRKKEMASLIYKTTVQDQTRYSYTEAVTLGAHKGSISTSKNLKTVATIHSHGEYTGYVTDSKGEKSIVKDNEFSKTDKATNKKAKLTGYLATPNGSLLEYNPSTENVEIISKDLPSDPNDPQRLNSIIPVDNTSLFSKIIEIIKHIFK